MEVKIIVDAAEILKNMPRTGWLQNGVPFYEAETVAEHTFEVATMLTIFSYASEKAFDKEKMLIMGIIHDLSESVSGDMPKGLTQRIGKESKSRTEKEIIKEISVACGLAELEKNFNEYEEGESIEAILVKIADRVSTIRQAKIYSKRGYDVRNIEEGYKEELKNLLQKVPYKEIRKIVTELIQ
jgi:putative hydrolase of HD superfamily